MGALGIAARAKSNPRARAISNPETGEVTSYHRLNLRAARLAGVLATRGVGAGDRVVIASLARREVFEAQLACSRLGAALVPINWRLADVERREVTAVARPSAVIVDEEVGFSDYPMPRIHLGDHYEHALAASTPVVARQPEPDEIAQILFTSGTTGRPKGAMIPWRQVEFNARATASMCELTESSGTLAFLPTFHTGGLNCLALPTLAAGGCVWLMKRFDADASAKLLGSGAIIATVAVPAMYRDLLEAGFGGSPLEVVNYLCGGAPLPDDIARAFRTLGCPLRQGFGMTEVGPNCFTGGSSDVGHPTPGTDARVVCERGLPVATGAVGELELRGPHVFRGYFENEQATRASMRNGWFRTGDLARVDARGRFTIAGRKKEMFISGGENVYPAEVEAALANHPAIAEVAVVGVPDDRWGEVGLATFTVHRGQDVDAAALRQYARSRLAGYKVPHHFARSSEMPRTATGKVAKADMANNFQPTFNKSQARRAAPSTPMETAR